ncbi:unnamed protein product [Owenia fusiformis]|uniref:ATP synthase subunit gamma n=1 Tax=Owenia fusiformis TaxID=6347 RepID=A0A8S4NT95_OWEFU|nr:unnamed protein product [Owenia fusiformis]
MLSRAVPVFTPQCVQVRNMATLKDIHMRLKSVTNIRKITKTMKMVSAAKYNKAERELKAARPYGAGARSFFEKAEVTQDESKPNFLMLALTSDRGLCGGVHSSISKSIRNKATDELKDKNVGIICVGDKSRQIISRTLSKSMLMHFVDIGKKPPVFADASLIANNILQSDFEYDCAEMVYNRFKTVMSYQTTHLPLFNQASISGAEKLSLYDSLDDSVLQSYNEFALASIIYMGLKEGACSEQSSRMTAMDGATKNAGEMIEKLQLTYNRTRQAVITRELIEIISGAAALKKAD